jgi:predicted adenylyl cyclase CyaB
MKLVNFEFKAQLKDETSIRAALQRLRARYVGRDHQIDTYFNVPRGRLKVREGEIENALIFYERSDSPRARRAKVEMMLLPRRNSVKEVLTRALGTRVVVDKRREIYFVGNVKIHLDRVRGLGKFVEVEAVSRTGDLAKARQQALGFQKIFGIKRADIVGKSYSNLKEVNH